MQLLLLLFAAVDVAAAATAAAPAAPADMLENSSPSRNGGAYPGASYVIYLSASEWERKHCLANTLAM